MPASPLVHLSAVRHVFPNGESERVVLDDVSCDISAGRLIALMGPSGSGKSTLMNILGGLARPTSGTVIVAGQDITKLSSNELTAYRGRAIGFIFQEWNLIPDLTALENVALPLRIAGQSAKQAARPARDALARVGLVGHDGAFPRALSGGEQQRVAIARSVVDGRPLLLADEPTGSLDSENGALVLEILRDIVNGGHRSALVATHDSQVAARCDEVWRIRDGRIVLADLP